MFYYYIYGDTFDKKEEIKKQKPSRKDFKNWWRYNKDLQCWELRVPHNQNSKKFQNSLMEFCNKNKFKLEIIETFYDTKFDVKQMSDFKTKEAFFDYFHKQGNKYHGRKT